MQQIFVFIIVFLLPGLIAGAPAAEGDIKPPKKRESPQMEPTPLSGKWRKRRVFHWQVWFWIRFVARIYRLCLNVDPFYLQAPLQQPQHQRCVRVKLRGYAGHSLSRGSVAAGLHLPGCRCLKIHGLLHVWVVCALVGKDTTQHNRLVFFQSYLTQRYYHIAPSWVGIKLFWVVAWCTAT